MYGAMNRHASSVPYAAMSMADRQKSRYSSSMSITFRRCDGGNAALTSTSMRPNSRVRLVGQRLHLIALHDIGRYRECAPANRFDFLRDRVEVGRRARGHHHVRAFLCAPLRQRRAQSGTRTGDHHDLILKQHRRAQIP